MRYLLWKFEYYLRKNCKQIEKIKLLQNKIINIKEEEYSCFEIMFIFEIKYCKDYVVLNKHNVHAQKNFVQFYKKKNILIV